MIRFRLLILTLIAFSSLLPGAFSERGGTFVTSAMAHNPLEDDDAIQPRGLVLKPAIKPLAPIPTCWKIDDVKTFNFCSAQREIVRKAVADTWESRLLDPLYRLGAMHQNEQQWGFHCTRR